jgi:DNA sulfur modification protein DndB
MGDHAGSSRAGAPLLGALNDYAYAFPAIRGVQAGRVFFVSMCPLKLLPKLFVWDDDDLPAELRAQRTLNKGRIPEIVRYIEKNRTDYTFSAITASIDADVRFISSDGSDQGSTTGVLRVPMDGRVIVNDGQHRRAAIEQALRNHPELGEETIAVVFFVDKGLERCQQMFADLNRHAVRPSKSIGVLYDHRDVMSAITRQVVLTSPVFRGVVEMESSSLSKTSGRLFTLSAIYGAHRALFDGLYSLSQDEMINTAGAFWKVIDTQFPEWEQVRQRQMRAPEVRADYIHTHGIVLTALGRVGNSVLLASTDPSSWPPVLANLKTLDWSRANSALWEGRAMIGGRVSKAMSNVVLTTAAIRIHLGMPLLPDEQRAEQAYRKEVRS